MSLIKLSPYHEIFYNEWKLNPSSSQYNIVFDQTISSTLNISRLRDALVRFIGDYLLVNSHVQLINNEPHWVTNHQINQLEYFATIQSDSELFKYVSRAFEVESQPLYRFAVFRLVDGNYRFISVFHHLIMDGSSGDEYVSETSKYYNDDTYKINSTIENQAQAIIYTTTTLTQKLENTKYESKIFWQSLLEDSEPLDLRFLKSPNKLDRGLQINPVQEIRFNFADKDLTRLLVTARKYVITPYVYSQCIFMLLLYKYTSQNKFTVAYPIAIKEHSGLFYGVGVNTCIFPCNITPNAAISNLIEYTKNITLKCKDKYYSYRHYPINQLMGHHNKNFLDVSFIQTNLKDYKFTFNNAQVLTINAEFNVDLPNRLLFEQELSSSVLNFRVRYDSSRIDETILSQFVRHYQTLFLEVLSDLEQGITTKLVSQYPVLTNIEYQTIVYEWNQTDQIYPEHKTIHQLFEEQVERTPDNIALVYEDVKLTYKQLNEKSNQLAHYLRNTYNIKGDDLIALCLTRNEYMLIAILAVLKAGAAYVPIDPECPSERFKFILQDTQSKIILINEQAHDKLQNNMSTSIINSKFIILDSGIVQTKLNKQLIDNPDINISSYNLAYVIYTSGTTGMPKGVLQQHNNIGRLFAATNLWFKFSTQDIWTMFHSYAFDFSVWEIWGALFYGGKLIIPSYEQTRDFEKFYLLCKSECVTVLNQTPSSFYNFSEIILKNYSTQKLTNLRYVIFGGEALNPAYLKSWVSSYGVNMPRLVNMYGITEITVHATYKQILIQEIDNMSLIGFRIPDQKLYVLDELLNPLPTGVIGELYIGGAGLARGYLNQAKLTQERFIANPFQTALEKSHNKNARLYKTGDLVRYLPDGNIEYIGRTDFQVKINGYRIELGDIENAIMDYPAIKSTVVILHEYISDNAEATINKLLVAYYVADTRLDTVILRKYLVGKLPIYMLPNIFMHINSMPLTVNGKLDKKALPPPNYLGLEYNTTLPRTSKEQIICGAFALVLNLHNRQFGIDDDFFDFGGTSILAIRLATRLQEHLIINVADIFKYRTPRLLAEKLSISVHSVGEKLNLIKSLYQNFSPQLKQNNQECLKDIDKYLQDANQLRFKSFTFKPIKNVLLTGTPGFLGCNLLYELLQSTNYNVFLLVRGDSEQTAYDRVRKQFQLYFGDELLTNCSSRISVLCGALDQNNLGLTTNVYENLIKQIDSVIHAAALIKHYGNYDEFYAQNVQATINLLEFTGQTKLKDFHYISTYSVLQCTHNAKSAKSTYTEEDIPSDNTTCDNVYVYTKLLGEHQVIRYRQFGLNANIYRIGNLAYIAKNHQLPNNVQENAFFNTLQYMIQTRKIAKEISQFEISQVDITANAIIKLFDKPELNNNIYHVFNPHKFDLTQAYIEWLNITQVPLEFFIEELNRKLDTSDLPLQFILRQGWLSKVEDIESNLNVSILQAKTEQVLKQLDFVWNGIASDEFSLYAKNLVING